MAYLLLRSTMGPDASSRERAVLVYIMPNEPLYVLIERMRRALQDAARVRERIEDRVKNLQINDETPASPTGDPSFDKDEDKDPEA